MSKLSQKTQTLIIFILIISLLLPGMALGAVGSAGSARMAKIQPALAEMAVQAPDEMIRVIVQKADGSGALEAYVQELGGQVLSELDLINAFVALLPGKQISEFIKTSAVNWVALDAPMVSTAKPVPLTTYRMSDFFDLESFDNNDGSADWRTPWIENDASIGNPIAYTYDVSGDPAVGQVVVSDGELYMDTNPYAGVFPSVARGANLFLAADARLTFNFRVGPGTVANEDVFVLEISTDNGETYTTVDTFAGNYVGGQWYSSNDISAFTSSEVVVRFRITNGYDGPSDFFAIDNVQLEYKAGALTPNYFLDTLNVRDAWDLGFTGAGIGIAVIDSGISPSRDVNVVRSVSFNLNSTTVQDVNGHGTHVAGIAAGNGTRSDGLFAGIAPEADLISLKISDETGMAYESDTVEALEWVFENKDAYNIRVVNLSVQSSVMSSYHDSPLTAAAEILWFNGIVVVAAAGNGYEPDFNPIMAAPANDPFIITVGATDEKGNAKTRDDIIAPFSAWGNTLDGYLKPEIYAPGKDIISVLSKSSDWDELYPERAVLGSNYFRISGTSMAAPMVSGAVALLLQAEPTLTPDQVKYRLIDTAGWVGPCRYLDVEAVVLGTSTESANQDVIPHMLLAKMAMIAYWSSAEGEENIDWENVDWNAVNWNAVNWNAVNWNAVNWNAVNWNAVNWNAVNWNAVNWNAVNWNAVNWNAVNWNAVNWNAVNWNAVNWNSTYWGEE